MLLLLLSQSRQIRQDQTHTVAVLEANFEQARRELTTRDATPVSADFSQTEWEREREREQAEGSIAIPVATISVCSGVIARTDRIRPETRRNIFAYAEVAVDSNQGRLRPATLVVSTCAT